MYLNRYEIWVNIGAYFPFKEGTAHVRIQRGGDKEFGTPEKSQKI